MCDAIAGQGSVFLNYIFILERNDFYWNYFAQAAIEAVAKAAEPPPGEGLNKIWIIMFPSKSIMI